MFSFVDICSIVSLQIFLNVSAVSLTDLSVVGAVELPGCSK